MRLHLATALLLASVAAAQAQSRAPSTNSSPAAQMAGRAAANANQVRDAAANGVASLYASPDDTPSEPPSNTQRVIRGQVNGTIADPQIHYPYGRYGATLGNIDPNSLANPFTRGAPGTFAPAPFATTSGTQGFHRGR
jgi:hypothetical protein